MEGINFDELMKKVTPEEKPAAPAAAGTLEPPAVPAGTPPAASIKHILETGDEWAKDQAKRKSAAEKQ